MIRFQYITGIILGVGSANDKMRFYVTHSLIGRAYKYDPCIMMMQSYDNPFRITYPLSVQNHRLYLNAAQCAIDGLVQHYTDVIMSTVASQIPSIIIVCSTVYSGSDPRKNQSSASLAFVRGIHR